MMLQAAGSEGPESMAPGIWQRPGLQECACGPAWDLVGATEEVVVQSPRLGWFASAGLFPCITCAFYLPWVLEEASWEALVRWVGLRGDRDT